VEFFNVNNQFVATVRQAIKARNNSQAILIKEFFYQFSGTKNFLNEEGFKAMLKALHMQTEFEEEQVQLVFDAIDQLKTH